MTSSSQNSRYPPPPDEEAVFGAALLVLGEVPRRGWYISRNPGGVPMYITAGSTNARKYQDALIGYFTTIIVESYSHRGWKPGHIYTVAQNWKNRYLLWLFREIERE